MGGLREKREGPGENVSTFQDERCGFGIPLSVADLVTANELRRFKVRPNLQESPGARFVVHRRNKEGYWGYAQFEEQVVDMMDVLEALYPDYQLMIEVDHSAGLVKYREDGLHVGDMNVRFGGKQRALRDTIMTEWYLGPGEAKINVNRCMWSTKYIEGTTTRTVDFKPKLGEAQTMSFSPGAPPRSTHVTPPNWTWLGGGHETRGPSAPPLRQPGRTVAEAR